MSRFPAVILASAVMFVLPGAVGDAVAESPAPPLVSLSAPSSLTAPDGSELIATAGSDVGPTPYYIRIYDDDSGAQVARCSSGTTCQVTISPGSEANADPQQRHFHAEINAAGVPARSTSGQVTAVVGTTPTRPLLGSDSFGPLAPRQKDPGGDLIPPSLPSHFDPPPS